MTKKELIAKIKGKGYEERVRAAAESLTLSGETAAADLMTSLYEDLKAFIAPDTKPSGKYFEDSDLDAAFCDFVSMRSKIKKPLTVKAIERAMIKLENLSAGNTAVKIKILEQSTDNCWAGLFSLKEEKNFERKHRNPNQSQLSAILDSISDD